MIPWLRRGDPFPPVAAALKEPSGLLAASRTLDADWLIEAYRRGIFPWYSEPEPILWWSPDPRMVLLCAELRIRRSLRKRLRAALAGGRLAIGVDVDFTATMLECAAPRAGQEGTWITAPIVEAYSELNRRGLAHSVEVFVDRTRVGGLYGVALGRMFYGESMFTRAPDASKLALVALVALLRSEQVAVIDCQQHTKHLESLGARDISRADFCAHLARVTRLPPIDWKRYQGCDLTELLGID